MRSVVFRYHVPVDDNLTIDLPVGARILTVQEQCGYPYIWALVNPDAPIERRTFRLAGTCNTIECHGELLYVGTFQLRGGALVFHMFETRPDTAYLPMRGGADR